MTAKFRSSSRTVVTEIRSFIVDKISRTGAFRQTVSTHVPVESTLSQQDINVSDREFVEIPKVNSIVAIHSPEPIVVRMTQRQPRERPPIDPPEIPDPSWTMTSEIYIGDFIEVKLNAPAVQPPYDALQVTAFNTTSGETEYVQLKRQNGMFVGTLKTHNGPKGKDFDGTMDVKTDDVLSFIYDKNYTHEMRVLSPYVDPKIRTVDRIFEGRSLPVMLVDPDMVRASHAEVTITNLVTRKWQVLTLLPADSGQFFGSMQTRGFASVGDTLSIVFDSVYYDKNETVTRQVDVTAPQEVRAALSVPERVPHGSKVRIELDDYNMAGSGSLQIPVTNSRTSNFQFIDCEELMPHSGIFVGFCSSSDAEEGDSLVATYVDVRDGKSVSIEASATLSVVQDAGKETPVRSLSVDDVATVPSTEFESQTVEMTINGLFYLHGEFEGTVEIRGLSKEFTRCTILHV